MSNETNFPGLNQAGGHLGGSKYGHLLATNESACIKMVLAVSMAGLGRTDVPPAMMPALGDLHQMMFVEEMMAEEMGMMGDY
jgi:hypothetical protein